MCSDLLEIAAPEQEAIVFELSFLFVLKPQPRTVEIKY